MTDDFELVDIDDDQDADDAHPIAVDEVPDVTEDPIEDDPTVEDIAPERGNQP